MQNKSKDLRHCIVYEQKQRGLKTSISFFLKEKREIRKEGSFWQNIPNSRDLLERFSRFDDAGVAMVIL